MGQATEYYYACAFVVSEDVVETVAPPGVFSGPSLGRLDALWLAIR